MANRTSVRKFTYSSDNEEESPRWSGHGKRIPHNQMSNYAMGIQVKDIPSRISQDKALGLDRIKRTASHESHASEASEQFGIIF
jgi:hypothetical protein